MNLVPLLFVPSAMVVLAVLLSLTWWLERRVLSPQSLIVSTARARHAEIEHVEQFVAAQSQLLLDELVAAVEPAQTPAVTV